MESNSGEVLFDIRHVSHTFETEEGKTFDALKDVTAQIKKGEFTAITERTAAVSPRWPAI